MRLGKSGWPSTVDKIKSQYLICKAKLWWMNLLDLRMRLSFLRKIYDKTIHVESIQDILSVHYLVIGPWFFFWKCKISISNPPQNFRKQSTYSLFWHIQVWILPEIQLNMQERHSTRLSRILPAKTSSEIELVDIFHKYYLRKYKLELFFFYNT